MYDVFGSMVQDLYDGSQLVMTGVNTSGNHPVVSHVRGHVRHTGLTMTGPRYNEMLRERELERLPSNQKQVINIIIII